MHVIRAIGACQSLRVVEYLLALKGYVDHTAESWMNRIGHKLYDSFDAPLLDRLDGLVQRRLYNAIGRGDRPRLAVRSFRIGFSPRTNGLKTAASSFLSSLSARSGPSAFWSPCGSSCPVPLVELAVLDKCLTPGVPDAGDRCPLARARIARTDSMARR